MSASDTERYFPSRAAIRAYGTMLRCEMQWWNWVAIASQIMFERVEQAVERRNRPQILILYLNVYMLVIVVVAPLALLVWIATSGNGLSFVITLIALIGVERAKLRATRSRTVRVV